MKDGKLEIQDLSEKDRIAALTILLISKGFITEKEVTDMYDAMLVKRNQHLDKELEENPMMKMMFDMMNTNKKED